jgi:phosphate transport system permease protein
VLTLMTLPTIIIASPRGAEGRAAVDPRGGARRGRVEVQTVLHHVLPLAMPGMLTGTIIGMARALGESPRRC